MTAQVYNSTHRSARTIGGRFKGILSKIDSLRDNKSAEARSLSLVVGLYIFDASLGPRVIVTTLNKYPQQSRAEDRTNG